jgi:hypothetical protein
MLGSSNTGGRNQREWSKSGPSAANPLELGAAQLSSAPGPADDSLVVAIVDTIVVVVNVLIIIVVHYRCTCSHLIANAAEEPRLLLVSTEKSADFQAKAAKTWNFTPGFGHQFQWVN